MIPRTQTPASEPEREKRGDGAGVLKSSILRRILDIIRRRILRATQPGAMPTIEGYYWCEWEGMHPLRQIVYFAGVDTVCQVTIVGDESSWSLSEMPTARWGDRIPDWP